MITRVILGEIPWTGRFFAPPPIPPHIQEIERYFLDLFAAFKPERSSDLGGANGYPPYELDAAADDAEVIRLLEQFDKALRKATRPGAAYFRQFPTEKEVARVRFLEPSYYADFVTEESGKELNAGLVDCAECGTFNPKANHDPLLVNKSVLKSYDVFHAIRCVLVVRKWVLDLLKDAVGDQIIHGNVVVARSKEQPSGDSRLFWIRPKAVIGPHVIRACKTRTCEVCGRTFQFPGGDLNDRNNPVGPGLLDERTQVENFGSSEAEIAVFQWWRKHPALVMSGALATFLKKQRVKGIVVSTKDFSPNCIFSAAGEPTLRAQAKVFASAGVKTTPKQSTSHLKARKTAASLKDLPWNCTADGHVYFHLSTPEFVPVDPMTAEDSGPYKVANFKGPGVYKLPVSAIKNSDDDGIAVDSATLLFVDNAFLSDLLDEFEWEKASMLVNLDWGYCQMVAEKVGTRFGVCTVPPKKFKSAFKGDGIYRIDAKQVKPV